LACFDQGTEVVQIQGIREMIQFLKRLFWPLIRGRYYQKDGSPKRCPYCGSKALWEEATEVLNIVTVLEARYVCGHCEREVGYWAYGAFDPKYRNAPPK